MRRTKKTGVTLLETLISLALSAGLLASIAIAFHASAMAVETGDRSFRSVQSARLCMDQFTREIRQAQKVFAVTPTSVHLLDSAGHDRTWQYVAASGNAAGLVRIVDATAGTTHTIATSVAAAQFTCKTGLIPNKTTWPVRVALVLAIQNGADQMILSGGALPRQEILY